MGLEKFHLTFLALLIYAVVKSNADCNSDLLTCSVHIAALSSVIGTNGQPPTAEQVQPFCPNVVTFQTCLNNVPENCKSDPMYDGYQQSAASFSVYCSGSGSGTGGSSGTCAVMDCMQIIQFESFKSCVTMKSKNCPPEIMATVKNMTDSQKMLCEGDCSTYKLLQCVKNVNVSAFQAISGLPTKGQLQPICREAESALKCMGDYFIKCPTSGDKKTKEATESLKMYEKILNVMCKEALPADWKKRGCASRELLKTIVVKKQQLTSPICLSK
ncbi:hypothetical protein KUTeg_005229 [Tegillarca granosa]|uniref:Uncharacterized protein n=1 Tax=Tegillarca granosa TaxID=220873 RepID=A0ABQ9FNN0_TEGGR|nr:hypothetical protein KUTeg_005229 [Tegillarca granosa]